MNINSYLCILVHQVSYGSELSNRGPTFDMDLSDFMDEGKPMSYEKAKKYFDTNPSQKWVPRVWLISFCSLLCICIAA